MAAQARRLLYRLPVRRLISVGGFARYKLINVLTSFSYSVSQSNIALNVDGTAYVGGVPRTAVRSDMFPDITGLKGCIAEVVVDGVLLNPTSDSAVVSVGVEVCEACN